MDQPRATRPGACNARRMTGRAFSDLLVWMLGLGVLVGITFPFLLLPLGVPGDMTLRPTFFAATLAAGLMLAGLNFMLTRTVVGARLRELSDRMRHVNEMIGEATFNGDWERCSPQACHLAVDSDDELGRTARSFNELISAMAESRLVQQRLAQHTSTLVRHLEVGDLAEEALTSYLSTSGADAGAFGIARDGELEYTCDFRIDCALLGRNPTITAALNRDELLVMDLPADLHVDAGLLSFRPRTVVVLPVSFRSEPVALCVLAFAEEPAPATFQTLQAMTEPTAMALQNALSHERFQRLAAIDPLTGAYNRRFGLARLDEEWSRSIRTSQPLGLLTFDLDHFKNVNDTYGHLAGDRVLRAAADAARSVIREGDVLVRIGGEEFLVVMPGGGAQDVRAVGERLRRAIGDTQIVSGHATVNVTVSVGAVAAPGQGLDSAEDLRSAADRALYEAKESGRNRLTMAQA